jgi:hypothetical protein
MGTPSYTSGRQNREHEPLAHNQAEESILAAVNGGQVQSWKVLKKSAEIKQALRTQRLRVSMGPTWSDHIRCWITSASG